MESKTKCAECRCDDDDAEADAILLGRVKDQADFAQRTVARVRRLLSALVSVAPEATGYVDLRNLVVREVVDYAIAMAKAAQYAADAYSGELTDGDVDGE